MQHNTICIQLRPCNDRVCQWGAPRVLLFSSRIPHCAATATLRCSCHNVEPQCALWACTKCASWHGDLGPPRRLSRRGSCALGAGCNFISAIGAASSCRFFRHWQSRHVRYGLSWRKLDAWSMDAHRSPRPSILWPVIEASIGQRWSWMIHPTSNVSFINLLLACSSVAYCWKALCRSDSLYRR